MTTETEVLLPCPFCGGEAFESTTLDDTHYVMCKAEDCWAMAGYLPTKAEAITAWNRRASQPATETEVLEVVGYIYEVNGEIEDFEFGNTPLLPDDPSLVKLVRHSEALAIIDRLTRERDLALDLNKRSHKHLAWEKEFTRAEAAEQQVQKLRKALREIQTLYQVTHCHAAALAALKEDGR